MEETHGKQSEAARRLGVTAQAVFNFIKGNPDLFPRLIRELSVASERPECSEVGCTPIWAAKV